MGDPAELTPLLDQLPGWRVLYRSYDGARATNLAEYRNRHYVYQFTQAAYRAVGDVLGARVDDAVLSDATPWRMSTTNYTMTEQGRAVMEERLIPDLLGDVAP